MIKLIKSYPYDNNYDYTKMFSNENEQKQFFRTFDYENVDDHNYIKIEKSFNVKYDYDYLENEGVNYVIFDNGYRTIYAFIIKKEYVRENLTKIIYEVDVIQTFMFDFSINNSFVERKVCSIDEIVDFDEGINLGEHIIETSHHIFNKDSVYFAMFNGFKEQELIFDGNTLKSVVDLPFSTSKPLTIIDGIQYPLYFMPLKESYKQATYETLTTPNGSGETYGGSISAKILRFIKGFEGFAPFPNYFNGEEFRTGGYGITENYQSKYFKLLGDAPISEKKASEVLAQMMNEEFASALYYRMLKDGLKGSDIKQHHFDAFISLAMNGGMGAVTGSPMYKKYLVNQDDPTIYDSWLNWYVTGEGLGVVLPGLVARRKQEAKIFKDGVYEYRTISVYNSRGVIDGTVTENNGHGYIPNTVNGGVE